VTRVESESPKIVIRVIDSSHAITEVLGLGSMLGPEPGTRYFKNSGATAIAIC